MKVDGGGWSWVEVGARFSNTRKNAVYLKPIKTMIVQMLDVKLKDMAWN